MNANIDGKNYTYNQGDMWNVQVGKNRGSYQTRYSFETPQQAMFYFNAINIGRGYKKRLMLVQNNVRKVVARIIS